MNPDNATTTTDPTTTEPTSTLPDEATPSDDAASHTADATDVTDATSAIENLVPMYGGGSGPRPDPTSLTTRRR